MEIKQQLNDLYTQKKQIEKEIERLENLQARSALDIIELKEQIYIDTSKVPQKVIKQLQDMATFDNPQVEILKKLRKPIYNTPYKIQGFTQTNNKLLLPRGLMRNVIELFATSSLDYSYKDLRFVKTIAVPQFSLELRPEQKKVIEKIVKKDFCICVASPGFGKTVIGAKMIEKRGVNTLVIVNKNLLLDQWCERFGEYFNIEKKDIGYLGKSKNKLTNYIDVATMQSLKNNSDLIKNYSFVIVDECHHIPALTFEKIIKKFQGKYILGLSATPNRKDGMEPLLYQQLGPIAYEQRQKKDGKKEYKIIETNFINETADFADFNLWLLRTNINRIILEQIIKHKNRKILVLTDRIEHIDNLELLLKSKNRVCSDPWKFE